MRNCDHADEQEGRKAGRPRSVEAHQAILDATLSLLSTQGFDAMSIEEVATRAGVGKTTIYRWWASKEALALEALQSLYARRRPIIDTGDLRHDLITMMEDFIQLMEEEGVLLENLTFKLLGELKTHPDLLKMFYSRIVEPRLQQFVQLVERAQERGELRQDLDPLVLYGLFCGPCFYRMLLSGKIAPYGPHWAKQVVDAALNGAAVRHEC
jgi:AcrR family transcriptional regulator